MLNLGKRKLSMEEKLKVALSLADGSFYELAAERAKNYE